MKKFLIAAALLASSVSVANAGCGTASLNGKWAFAALNATSHTVFTILNGSFGGIGSISQNSTTCKVTLLISGQTYLGRTENLVGEAATRKPNLMILHHSTNTAVPLLVLTRF